MKYCKKCGKDTERFPEGRCIRCKHKYDRENNYKGVNWKSTREEQEKFKEKAREYCKQRGLK